MAAKQTKTHSLMILMIRLITSLVPVKKSVNMSLMNRVNTSQTKLEHCSNITSISMK